jgi:hypothetical protein
MFKKYILVFGLLFIFSGCGALSKFMPQKSSEPQWLLNPSIGAGEKIAAVGCAKSHFKGISHQKKLAVQRAISQIAIQKQSKVQTVSLSKKSSRSSGYGRSYDQTSMAETNTNVSTKVKEYYTKKNGEVCAWVIEN